MKAKAVTVAVLAGLAVLAAPLHAGAAARVSVANEFGNAEADPTYMTTLRLRGSGFQAIENGHGGIYVFFGTVESRWRPSQGGITGKDYLYVPDAEAKDNQGFQRFIAFQGSDTASTAQGTIAADGSWATSIKVPGATFDAVDRSGRTVAVNCRQVRCGIITVGAHGVKNANNESFTPIAFTTLYDEEPTRSPASTDPGTSGGTEGDDGGSDTGNGDMGGGGGTEPATSPATAAVDLDTAVLGRVLSFTGAGFTPGEQVTASFDNGMAAVGPLPAGASGEVGGVLQLPADIQPGTHTLRLTGAASGYRAEVNFPIIADPAPASFDGESTSDGLPAWGPWAFLGVGVVLLVAAGAYAFRRFRSIRAARGEGAVRAP
jgi:uncharacterized membrane protein YgcG